MSNVVSLTDRISAARVRYTTEALALAEQAITDRSQK